MIVLTDLAVRPSPVPPAVETLPAPPGGLVLHIIEPTLGGPVVTLAG